MESEKGRWIPYSMPAVDAVREALWDGSIQQAAVPQVFRNTYVFVFILFSTCGEIHVRFSYLHAFDSNSSRVTRPVVCMVIEHQLHGAGAP